MGSCSSRGSSFREQYTDQLRLAPLPTREKSYITSRYVTLVEDALRDYWIVSATYGILWLFIIVATALILSFTSLDKAANLSPDAQNAISWTLWGLALGLAIALKLETQFDITKKYILNSVIVDKMESEGWSFLSGTGNYSNDYMASFRLFSARIEQLHLKTAKLKAPSSDNSVDDMIAAGSNSTIVQATSTTNTTIITPDTHATPDAPVADKGKEPDNTDTIIAF